MFKRKHPRHKEMQNLVSGLSIIAGIQDFCNIKICLENKKGLESTRENHPENSHFYQKLTAITNKFQN